MDQYVIEECRGEGIHGIVLKCRHKSKGTVVALKKVRIKHLDHQGLQPSILQEIKSLQQLDSENIVRLLDVFPNGCFVGLIMEYVDYDLSTLLRDIHYELTISRIKKIIQMLMKGLECCHRNNIVHRDLKPENLLLTNKGCLKIGDFSQAKLFDKLSDRKYSHQVATRWYRAPELLYGSQDYDEGVDLWAAGCIIAELFNRWPLFRADNDIEQLCLVLQALGTPNDDIWPGVSELPDYKKITFPHYEVVPFKDLVPNADPTAISLLEELLIYAPWKRIRAKNVVVHRYFFMEPLPICCLNYQPL